MLRLGHTRQYETTYSGVSLFGTGIKVAGCFCYANMYVYLDICMNVLFEFIVLSLYIL